MFIYKKFCVFHLVILIENKIFKCVANFDQIQREKKLLDLRFLARGMPSSLINRPFLMTQTNVLLN